MKQLGTWSLAESLKVFIMKISNEEKNSVIKNYIENNVIDSYVKYFKYYQ